MKRTMTSIRCPQIAALYPSLFQLSVSKIKMPLYIYQSGQTAKAVSYA